MTKTTTKGNIKYEVASYTWLSSWPAEYLVFLVTRQISGISGHHTYMYVYACHGHGREAWAAISQLGRVTFGSVSSCVGASVAGRVMREDDMAAPSPGHSYCISWLVNCSWSVQECVKFHLEMPLSCGDIIMCDVVM